MGSIKSKIISVMLSALWVLCILQCYADKASAHWHSQESGKVHHHHHSSNGADKHEHGEPSDQDSHSSGVVDCCELMLRLSTVASVDRDALDQSQAAQGLPFIFSLYSTIPSTNIPGPEVRSSVDYRVTDLSRHVRSLRVPNAPPSNVVN